MRASMLPQRVDHPLPFAFGFADGFVHLLRELNPTAREQKTLALNQHQILFSFDVSMEHCPHALPISAFSWHDCRCMHRNIARRWPNWVFYFQRENARVGKRWLT